MAKARKEKTGIFVVFPEGHGKHYPCRTLDYFIAEKPPEDHGGLPPTFAPGNAAFIDIRKAQSLKIIHVTL
jgi:hypothetical protein